ncbi:unnamed protein product, partial [Brassica rapa]
MMRRQGDEEESRAFYDLSALVLSLLRYPPMPISLPNQFPDSVYPIRPPSQISTSGFRVAASRDICGSYALWIRYVLHRFPLVALGSCSDHCFLRRRDRFRHFHSRGRSMLCYVLTPPPSSTNQFHVCGGYNVCVLKTLYYHLEAGQQK